MPQITLIKLIEYTKYEFALSLAQTPWKPMRLQIRILKPVWNVVESAKSESSIVSRKNWTNLQKFFVFFSFYKLVS